MVNVFSNPKKRDDLNEENKQTIKQENLQAKPSEQTTSTLQKLKTEEAQLAEEKRNLIQMKEQLQKKIKDQIENSKNNVEKLKAEIDALKAECSELNVTIEHEVFAE